MTTAPAFPYDASTLAAIQRMGAAGGAGSYNSNAYDAGSNPLGMAQGGHRTNFPASLADVEQVAQAIALAAAIAANGGALAAAQASTTVYTATAGQTSFAATYSVGYVDVWMNGVLLAPADFTATSGTAVVLADGARVGDVVIVRTYLTGQLDSLVAEKAADYTLSNRDKIIFNTTANGTLPPTPSQGYEVWIGALAGVTVTVLRNGSTISGVAANDAVTAGTAVRYIYSGATWRRKSDGALL